MVFGTQLLIYSLAAGVCGQRALEGRSIGRICPGTLEQWQGGFDSTLKLLLALLGGVVLTRMVIPVADQLHATAQLTNGDCGQKERGVIAGGSCPEGLNTCISSAPFARLADHVGVNQKHRRLPLVS